MKPLKLVQEKYLDCHDTGCVEMPAVCRVIGLNDDNCIDCPFPECIGCLPNSSASNNGISIRLYNRVRQWQFYVKQMPDYIRHRWLVERITSWMYRDALELSRNVVQNQEKYDREMVTQAHIFIRNMTGCV